MPHPKRFLIKFLLLTLIIIATILLIKPSSKLTVKAATPCPGQDLTKSQIQIVSGFLSLANSTSQSGYYAPGSDTNSNCFITADTQAGIESAFLSYENLFNTYYNDLNSSSVQKPVVGSSSDIKLDQGKTIMYNSSDPAPNTITLEAVSGSPIVVNGVYVVFIKGNLSIKSNITSTDTNGVVFVVQGDVNIDHSVNQIDAFIINYGSFCDNWTGFSCSDDGSAPKNITFNGSVISINDISTGITAHLNFVRVSDNPGTNPAETINYSPKYFTLFKDIFSKDVTIWTEIK